MERVADPLWPVGLLCALVIFGTATLEVLARRRLAEPEAIQVSTMALASAGTDAGDDSDEVPPGAAPPVDEAHQQARAFARRGELERALGLFSALIAAHPASGVLKADYGYWLIKAEQYQPAVDALLAARGLGEDTAVVALNLGAALRRTGDTQGAERAFRHALQLRPGFLDAQLALAQLQLRAGKIASALSVLARAASSGSNDERARALLALGRAQLLNQAPSQAQKSFEAAINRAPSSSDLRWRIAKAWLKHGKRNFYGLALAAAENAARLAPDDVKVLLTLGQAREATADRSGARVAYERVLAQAPEETYARRRLLRLALLDRNFQRARREAEALIRQQPDEPEHHFLSGLVASRDERVDDARAHYRKAIETAHGNYPEAWFNLGLLEKHGQHLEAAVIAYQKAIEQKPRYLEAMNNLGLALAALGKRAEAEASYRHAIELDSKYGPAYKNLASLYERDARYAEAVGALESALRARPGDRGARRRLATAKLEIGDVPAALATFQGVLDEAPDDSEAWIGLSRAQQKAGRLDAAEASLARALELAPGNLDTLRQRAALLSATGAVARAKNAYQELIDHAPGDVAARIAFAEVLEREGDYQRCSEEAGRALRVEQGSRRAQELKRLCSSKQN